MEIENEFVPYEQALALKELGFDEPCFGWYDNERSPISVGESWRRGKNSIVAPTFSQAFRWFREKYDIICHPERWGQNLEYACKFDLYDKKERKLGHIRNEDNTLVSFKTYKEAELECLVKLIDIVKKQNLKG